MQREKRTQGILLKKTLLVNDDAFLEFLTQDFGRISVSVKKFARSKKKASEIDYFRLIELSLIQGRTSMTLKDATTIQIFSECTASLDMNKTAFSWLEIVKKITLEYHPDTQIFKKVLRVFSGVSNEFLIQFDIFFRIKMLDFSGFFVRFDSMRGDVFFNPIDFSFSLQKKTNTLSIKNTTRQLIEFLRRSDFETFYEKKENFPLQSCLEIQQIILEIEKKHY